MSSLQSSCASTRTAVTQYHRLYCQARFLLRLFPMILDGGVHVVSGLAFWYCHEYSTRDNKLIKWKGLQYFGSQFWRFQSDCWCPCICPGMVVFSVQQAAYLMVNRKQREETSVLWPLQEHTLNNLTSFYRAWLPPTSTKLETKPLTQGSLGDILDSNCGVCSAECVHPEFLCWETCSPMQECWEENF